MVDEVVKSMIRGDKLVFICGLHEADYLCDSAFFVKKVPVARSGKRPKMVKKLFVTVVCKECNHSSSFELEFSSLMEVLL